MESRRCSRSSCHEKVAENQKFCVSCGFVNDNFKSELKCLCGQAFLTERFCVSCGRRKPGAEMPESDKNGKDNNHQKLRRTFSNKSGQVCESCKKETNFRDLCNHCKEMVCPPCWQQHYDEMKTTVAETTTTLKTKMRKTSEYAKELDRVTSDAHTKCDKACDETLKLLEEKINERRHTLHGIIDRRLTPKRNELLRISTNLESANTIYQKGKSGLETWGHNPDYDTEVYISAKEYKNASDVDLQPIRFPEFFCQQDKLDGILNSIDRVVEPTHDVEICNAMHFFDINNSIIHRLAVTPSGNIAIICSTDDNSKVRFILYDETGEKKSETSIIRKKKTKIMYRYAFAASDDKLFASTDKKIFVFDYKLKLRDKIKIKGAAPLDLAYNFDDEELYILTNKKTIAIYSNLNPNDKLRTFPVNKSQYLALEDNSDVVLYSSEVSDSLLFSVIHRYTKEGYPLNTINLEPPPNFNLSHIYGIRWHDGYFAIAVREDEVCELQLYKENGVCEKRCIFTNFGRWFTGIGTFDSGKIVVGASNGKVYHINVFENI